MPILKTPASRRIRLDALGEHPVIELAFYGLNYDESAMLVAEYTDWLQALPAGQKARVLVDFAEALYVPRLALLWKQHLALFNAKVEKSAIINLSPLAALAVQGFIAASKLAGFPTGANRAVYFKNRQEATEWLSSNDQKTPAS